MCVHTYIIRINTNILTYIHTFVCAYIQKHKH